MNMFPPAPVHTRYPDILTRLMSNEIPDILGAINEVQESQLIPQKDKLELFTLTLNNERQDTSKFATCRHAHTIKRLLVCIGHLDEIPIETGFEMVSSYALYEKGSLRYYGLEALGDVVNFPDRTDRRRIDILTSVARDPSDSWNRISAIEGMKGLSVSNEELAHLLLPNIYTPNTHSELVVAAKILIERDYDPSKVMMLCLRSLSPENTDVSGDWRIQREAMPLICKLVAERAYPNLGRIVETAPVDLTSAEIKRFPFN